jgi:hypothetical protein
MRKLVSALGVSELQSRHKAKEQNLCAESPGNFTRQIQFGR